MQHRPFLAAVSAFLMLAPAAALAQDAYRPPTQQQIIEALSKRPEKADEITGSRTLDYLFGERGVTSDEEDAVPSIDVRVNFDFDSIELGNETLLTLTALGNALVSEELAGQTIVIVGHTDARGTDDYNDDLSRRRAAAVVDYLIRNFTIDRDLISFDGRGEQQLLLPDDPENELNRRVEIRNVTEEG